MKIAVVVASLTRSAGGLFDSLLGMSHELARFQGVEVHVLSLDDKVVVEDLKRWSPLPASIFPVYGPRAFGYAPAMKRALLEGDFDIAHTNGLWMYNSAAISGWRRNTKRPYVISPHGMIDPWAISNSRWKKRIVGWCFENKNLHNAACLHALCESEAKAMRAYGLKNPICIIPNGIDLPRKVESSELSVESPLQSLKNDGRKALLYLGRIHPKKGLVNLLRAWKQTHNSQRPTNDWLLAIAGWDQGGHEAELKRLATELEIPWMDVRSQKSEDGSEKPGFSSPTSDGRSPASVFFLGPQFGDHQAATYRNCDAFILPSLSEGLPMVVLEAWSHGKPVLMTEECNLPEGFAAEAAIRIEPNVEGIGQGLRKLFSATEASRMVLGANGSKLVSDRFTRPKVAIEMKSVYEWILGGGQKPDCVRVK